MGRSQRIKGKNGELEFAAEIRELLGIECGRQLGQERDGGCDVKVGDVDVQVKRTEKVPLRDFQMQALADTEPGRLTALAHRYSRGRWWVMMPLEDWASLVRDGMES